MEVTHIFLTSLWCVGLWRSFDTGMIFGKLDLILQKKLSNFVYKPLIGCVTCMASVHGFVAYFLFNYSIDVKVIPFIVCVAGLNSILSYFLD